MSLQDDLLKLAEIDFMLNQIKEEGLLAEDSQKRIEKLFELAGKFVDLRLKIKSEFAKNSAIIIKNSKAKELLQKINSDKLFFADIIFKSLE
ncbi:MAG: hypothetical protein D6732_01550, partial [Methanobacteriota archaeon]